MTVPIINKLPVETLLRIFMFAITPATSFGPTFQRAGPLRPPPSAAVDATSIYHLMRVSVYWKDVILDCPFLWRRFEIGQDAQYTAFLQRAKQAPLSLSLNDFSFWQQPHMPGALARITPLTPRLRRLDFIHHTYPVIGATWNDSIFRLDMPQLRCLKVTFIKYGDWSLSGNSIKMLSIFQRNELPLRALALCGVCDWLPSNTFPTLTHLHLSFFHSIRDDVSLKLQDILSLLSRTQTLHFLQLEDIWNPTSDSESPAHHISLHHLHSISLQNCDASVLSIFYHIDLPSDVVFTTRRTHRLLDMPGTRSSLSTHAAPYSTHFPVMFSNHTTTTVDVCVHPSNYYILALHGGSRRCLIQSGTQSSGVLSSKSSHVSDDDQSDPSEAVDNMESQLMDRDGDVFSAGIQCVRKLLHAIASPGERESFSHVTKFTFDVAPFDPAELVAAIRQMHLLHELTVHIIPLLETDVDDALYISLPPSLKRSSADLLRIFCIELENAMEGLGPHYPLTKLDLKISGTSVRSYNEDMDAVFVHLARVASGWKRAGMPLGRLRMRVGVEGADIWSRGVQSKMEFSRRRLMSLGVVKSAEVVNTSHLGLGEDIEAKEIWHVDEQNAYWD